MEKNDTAVKICGTTEGRLPGSCAPLAFPYVPVQCDNPARYSQQDALQAGFMKEVPDVGGLVVREAAEEQLTMAKEAGGR